MPGKKKHPVEYDAPLLAKIRVVLTGNIKKRYPAHVIQKPKKK